jgi:hypothetical protein
LKEWYTNIILTHKTVTIIIPLQAWHKVDVLEKDLNNLKQQIDNSLQSKDKDVSVKEFTKLIVQADDVRFL